MVVFYFFSKEQNDAADWNRILELAWTHRENEGIRNEYTYKRYTYKETHAYKMNTYKVDEVGL